VSACRRCNNAKASANTRAGRYGNSWRCPFTPTYAEYIFLKGRRVLADQMEYSDRTLSPVEPAARAHATLAHVNAGAVRRCVSGLGVLHRRQLFHFFGPTIPCRPTLVDGDGKRDACLVRLRALHLGPFEQVRPGTHRASPSI